MTVDPLPPFEAIEALQEWKIARGSLMFRKKVYELTNDERKMMRTPPDGWSYCIEASDYVYANS